MKAGLVANAFILSCLMVHCFGQPPNVTLCNLLSTPATYSGRIVSLRASVAVDYHGYFLANHKCRKMLPLVLPDGSEHAPKIVLKEDDSYKRFDEAIHDYRPGTSLPRKSVSAQFEGRFESLSGTEDSRGARWQLVLQSVSSVQLGSKK